MQTQIALSKDKKCSQIQKRFQATISYTIQAKAKGLSGKNRKLEKEEAMLFVYDEPQLLSFWMKETSIPLQIAFFNSQGSLVKTYEMNVEKDPSSPLQKFPSLQPVVLALEMRPQSLKSIHPYTLCITQTDSTLKSDTNIPR